MVKILVVGPGMEVPERPEWEIVQVAKPNSALELADKEKFDVVIGVVDGDAAVVRLLALLKDRHPSTLRVLVGQESVIAPTVSFDRLAHDRLASPVDIEALDRVVTRGLRLRGSLSDARLVNVIERTSGLPSFPALYTQVTEELESEEPSIQRIGSIVSRDPGLTAKMLHLINSPFYGLRREVVDPQLAVGLLGLQSLLSLILSVQIFSQFEAAAAGVSVQQLWLDALTVATLARKIAEIEVGTDDAAGEAFVAGMLHDGGRLVLASNFPQEYSRAMARVASGESLCDAERAELGVDHGEVGAFLIDRWGLPDRIVEAIAFHHRPLDAGSETFDPLTAVHVAQALDRGNGEPDHVDESYLASLGLADRLDRWMEACTTLVEV